MAIGQTKEIIKQDLECRDVDIAECSIPAVVGLMVETYNAFVTVEPTVDTARICVTPENIDKLDRAIELAKKVRRYSDK